MVEIVQRQMSWRTTVVLWAYRTTPKHSTRLSPFHLSFGTEAVLPTKLMLPTSRTLAVDSGINSSQLQLDQGGIDELRGTALRHIIKYQEAMKLRYDKKVKKRTFKPGDWVLRRVIRSADQWKFDENWKGPYIVDSPASKGSYFLRTIDGELLQLPWNGVHLKLFYR